MGNEIDTRLIDKILFLRSPLRINEPAACAHLYNLRRLT